MVIVIVDVLVTCIVIYNVRKYVSDRWLAGAFKDNVFIYKMKKRLYISRVSCQKGPICHA